MSGFGPFPLSAGLLLIAFVAAALCAVRVARGRDEAQRRRVAPLLMEMLLVGAAAARLTFVAVWWRDYAADPWALLRIGDGGYLPWLGAMAAVAYGAWHAWRMPTLRQPLAAGVVAGALVWLALAGSITLMRQSAMHVPDVALTRLEGGSARLSQMTGKPLVVNLWATWCPPCRREMPVLGDAQRAYPGVAFAFVDQGEGQDVIERYLTDHALPLRNVFLDPLSSVSQAAGVHGYPTTLFFRADGRLADLHMGELSRAGLAAKLQSLGMRPGTPSDKKDMP